MAALTISGARFENDHRGQVSWTFRCDCGSLRVANSAHVRYGKIKSLTAIVPPSKLGFIDCLPIATVARAARAAGC